MKNKDMCLSSNAKVLHTHFQASYLDKDFISAKQKLLKILFDVQLVNSLRPGDAFMRLWTGQPSVKVMA